MKTDEGLRRKSRDERSFRRLVEAVTDYAIYMLDANGIVTSWNAGARRIKGYTAARIIGQHFSLFYTEEDRQAGLPARALEIAAREGRFEHEGWRVRRDGSRFWANVVIDPVRTRTGRILGFAKVTRDLTERRKTEEALRASQEQFRLLVQGVSDYAIYMLDPTGHVTNWNLGAERIKGYQPAEIVGRHFSCFYTEEDRASGQPARGLAAAAQNGAFEIEGWRIRKDGTRFRAHVVIDSIRDRAGTLLGFAKITRDVTERYEAQRTLDQTREALVQSQKMDAIGQLTGGVAHDFNNLLMVVLGSLELLAKRLPDDPKAAALLASAVQGAERGASLTRRMLAFSRREELKPEIVGVPALVAGMADLMQRSIGPSIALETRFAADLSPVLADANALEAALLNLAVNARDAMPDGGKLLIEAQESDVAAGLMPDLKGGRYVRLAVTDTGVGMDAATLARAVEPFFTTKGVGQGTGLGLAMVHGVAAQSGGSLMLKSQPGAGTTAEIWLPIAPRNVAEASAEDDDAQANAATRPLVVLAVDDDALVLTSTTGMLEDLGHAVIDASSGEEALAILQRESVDLVITDHAMPHMTGTQLAVRIRSEREGLPIILATGYSDVPTGRLPKLHKPFADAMKDACPPSLPA
jgi:PAS domain S-box-containing protein